MKTSWFKILFVLFFIVLTGAYTTSFAQSADLAITKASRHHQNSGNITTFIITVRNNGPNAATNVVVTDNLNAYWNFNNPTSNHNVSHGSLSWGGTANRNLTWNIPYLANGSIAVLIFNTVNNYNNNQWDMPPEANVNNTATIASLGQTDLTPGNNTTTISSQTTSASFDMMLEQTVSNETPMVGERVVFTIAAARISGSGAEGTLQITSKLPAGFEYVDAVANNGSYNSSTGVWSLSGAIGAENLRTLHIVATVKAPTPVYVPDQYKMVAAITSAENTVDPVVSNNIAYTQITPAEPPIAGNVDLSISQTITHHQGGLNNKTNIALIVRNNSSSAATNVVVKNNLYRAWDFVEPLANHSASHGTLSWTGDENRNIKWTIPYIPGGGVAVLLFSPTNNFSNGQHSLRYNTAVVTPLDVFDPNLTNNFSFVQSLNGSTNTNDLALSKTINNTTPNVGDPVQFTITLSKLSGGTNTNMQVIDKLPPGFAYVGTQTIPSGDSYTPSTGIWNISQNSYNFTSRTLVINATVQGPTGAPNEYKNVASITTSGLDPFVSNNIASATAIVTVNPTATNDIAVTVRNAPVTINILGNDTYNTLNTVSISQQPASGNVIVNGLTNVTYTPNTDYTGPDSFKYTITDQYGISNEATVSITVNMPPAPIANNDATTTCRNTSININVLSNDTNTLGITSINGSSVSANGGTVTVNGVTDVTYTPPANFVGSDTFIYTLTGPGGTSNSATVTVTILAPVANNDNATTYLNNPVTINVLSNDINTSGITAINVNSPSVNGGTVMANGVNNITYTPPAGFIGTDTFTYSITADCGTSASATVTVNVNADPCGNCTNTISGSTITVNHGEVWCLPSGSWSGGVTMNGGTICISSGATFTASYTNGAINGTIINRGTSNISLWELPHAVHIQNYGILTSGGLVNVTGNITNYVGATINTGQIADFKGRLENYGTIINSGGTTFSSGGSMLNVGNYSTTNIQNISGLLENQGTIINSGGTSFLTGGSLTNTGTYTSTTFQNFSGTLNNSGPLTISGDVSFLSGAEVVNHGDINFGKSTFTNTTVLNYNKLRVNAGLDVYSGYWDNRLGGEVYFNGGNVNFTGDLDNSGYWEFERISSLSSTLNNYGKMKVFNAASNISSTTYLTNDDLLEFINVPDVQYNGPMLTNNGTISIIHGSAGNFKMNQEVNQVFNNGTIRISGQFELNKANSLLVNNCTIECKTFFVGNGTTNNSGLIYATGNGSTEGRPDGINIEGSTSYFNNSSTGFVRGVNFRNSGQIRGYGAFYFTGNTNANSGGSIIGDAPNSILFYDVSQTGNQIFDVFVVNNPAINVIRPSAMIPMDTDSYNCTAPPSVAGYPPKTSPFIETLCEPSVQTFSLAPPNVAPHVPVGGQSFTVLYNTVKLFNKNNANNPTNNTTNLVIPDTGVFVFNESTKLVTFTPDPAFTGGTVEAQYRISNSRSGDPIVYPSAKTLISITIIPSVLQPITLALGTEPLCIGQNLTLAHTVAGGVWSSSATAVATIDTNGVLSGLSVGTTTITYTVNNGVCTAFVTRDITIQNCTGTPRKVISNPMLRNRARTN